VPISWAEDHEQALESAREWKATLVDEHVTEPIHDPAEIQRNGREIRNGDRAREHLGRGPARTLRVYGERVLPQLRA
jgi:hypothetical protein